MFKKLKKHLQDRNSRALIKRFMTLLKDREIDSALHGLQRLCDNPFHRHITLFVQPVLPPSHPPVFYHLETDWKRSMNVIFRHQGTELEDIMSMDSETQLLQAPKKELTEALEHEVDRLQLIWLGYREGL